MVDVRAVERVMARDLFGGGLSLTEARSRALASLDQSGALQSRFDAALRAAVRPCEGDDAPVGDGASQALQLWSAAGARRACSADFDTGASGSVAGT